MSIKNNIPELNEQQLKQIANLDIGKAAILLTTPLCGTCKVALTMLNIVAQTGVPHKLFQVNINFTPYFRELWKIKSVPALVIIENGELNEIIYALHSVSSIYERLHFNKIN